jgi:hypothetical protein
MWATSINPHAPGKPTDAYNQVTRFNSTTFPGSLMYSSPIFMKASRNLKKNLQIADMEIWHNAPHKQNAAPLPKM